MENMCLPGGAHDLKVLKQSESQEARLNANPLKIPFRSGHTMRNNLKVIRN